MGKNYTIWHKLKTFINNHKTRIFFYEGEIWFCRLGMNIGFEQDGKGEQYIRPVIILKKFNHQVFWAIPLTKTAKEGKYYYQFCFKLGIVSNAILSQIRLIDAKRLEYKVGVINRKDLAQIKLKLKHLLE